MGEKFYIILTGRVGVYISMKKGDQALDREVAELGPGDSFGELALINDAPRTATVICKADSRLATMSKIHYNRILSSISLPD